MRTLIPAICFLILGTLGSTLITVCTRGSSTRRLTKVNASKSVEEFPSSPDLTQWKPPSFLGLKLGESTEKDVRRFFGDPAWEGTPEEKTFTDDREEEIEMEYHNVVEAKGNLVITLGKDSMNVKAITVYPNNPKSKEEVISEFGSEYFEIDSSASICIPHNRKPGETKEMRYPIALVYPNKGLYVSIQADKHVNHLAYLEKCELGRR